MRVYVVIDDHYETTVRMVTADRDEAHADARSLVGPGGEAREARPGVTVYDGGHFYVRVEAHELRRGRQTLATVATFQDAAGEVRAERLREACDQ